MGGAGLCPSAVQELIDRGKGEGGGSRGSPRAKRGTTKRSAFRSSRAWTGRGPAESQSPSGRARSRGVARRRSLVDRGSGSSALFRRRAGRRRTRGRLPGRGSRRLVQPARGLALVALLAHSVDEAVGGRVDVEEARAAGPGIAEAVPHAWGSCDEGAHACADGLVADR